jgi:phosphoglucosamine mutase
MVPTPVLALGTKLSGASAGAMITASHNPPEYNGLKFWDASGIAYTPEVEKLLEQMYFKRGWTCAGWLEVGDVEHVDISGSYLDEIKKNIDFSAELKIVADCGNGAASGFTPLMLRELGCEVVSLNSHPDGRFPGRGLEPIEENLGQLRKAVVATGADLGVAHDGDGDRIGAVDEKGNFVKADRLLALLAAAQVKKRGEVVVTTVDASRLVQDVVERAGGRVVYTRVGDVAVAQQILKSRAVFGGEPSGSWIFPRVHLAPDGLLSALMIIRLLEESGRKLSELSDELPNYFTVREKIACSQAKKVQAMSQVSKFVSERFKGEVSTIDGVRVELEDGWVLIRPSGTEPYIRVTAEGRTLERAGELAGIASELVKKVLRDVRP